MKTAAVLFFGLTLSQGCPPNQTEFVNGNGTEQPCYTICPPTLTQDNELKYCGQVCPEFYSCSKERRGHCPPSTSSPTAPCKPTEFYHPIKHFCSCVDECKNTSSEYCSTRCPGYYECLQLSVMMASDSSTSRLSSTKPAQFTESSPEDKCGLHKGLTACIALATTLAVISLILLIVTCIQCRKAHQKSRDKDKDRQQTPNVREATALLEVNQAPA